MNKFRIFMSREVVNELINNPLDSTTALTRMKQHLICFSPEIVNWYVEYFRSIGADTIFMQWLTLINKNNYTLNLDSKCTDGLKDIEALFKDFDFSMYIRSQSDPSTPEVNTIEYFDNINDFSTDCKFNRYCIPSCFKITTVELFNDFKAFLSFMTYNESTIYLVDPYIFKTDAFRVLYHPIFKRCPKIIIYYSDEYEPNDSTKTVIASINNSRTGRHIQYKHKT